ncbi:MAG: OsmC family protein [Syntrophales bacterium]|nr:OsmC family protein [Syntrophales bacterium]
MSRLHQLKAESVLLNEGMQVESRIREFTLRLDEPKELGGTNTGPNPVEVLLSSLGACQCLTARFVARLRKIDLAEFRVTVQGELDFDGFLKGDGSVRPGLQIIRVNTYVKSSAPPDEIKAMLVEVEKRCPVGDSILHGVRIEMNHEIITE